jgi:hypothetical protein
MKLIIEAENTEELQIALESIVPLVEQGYDGGNTNNGCYWYIEEK